MVKGITGVKSLSDAIKKANVLIEQGNEEKSNQKISWRYSLNESDIFSIPTIKFNIEKHYNNIIGQTFKVSNKEYHLQDVYPRTGFILNENGAVIESESTMSTDSTVVENIKPKAMIFDKPFFIIIKRQKSENPYFVMWVRNSELLTKKG